ncbi:hypothetical protein EDC01DRAFT_318320 [Geopyxis carbonaria]|nr:hypothetical protein EDC01DRAFT_318320 [Geopyxis carbonaria]
MSKPYATNFDDTHKPASGSNNLDPNSNVNYKTNIHRNKTKRWVEAPKVDYGGGWGDDDDEYDDYDDGYGYDEPQQPYHQQQPVAPLKPSAPAPAIRRQNSFDRGDEAALSPAVESASRTASWGKLPPTPAELEQEEMARRAATQPPPPPPQITHTPVAAALPPPPSVPVINVPGGHSQSPAGVTSPIDNPYYQSSQPQKLPQYQNEAMMGSRERVPPPLGAEPEVERTVSSPPASSVQKPLPVPEEAQEVVQTYAPPPGPPPMQQQQQFYAPPPGPPPMQQQQQQPLPPSPQPEQPASPEPVRKVPSFSIDKPTPPLPPPEDYSLETITEHSLPASPKESAPPKVWAKTPSYDDYEYDDYSGYGDPQPLYTSQPVPANPSSPPPAPLQREKPQRPTVTPPPMRTDSAASPASPGSASRIIRPSDIYKRHQETRRVSEDSTRPSLDGQEPNRSRKFSDPPALQPRLHSRDRVEDLRTSGNRSRSSSREGREQGMHSSGVDNARARSSSRGRVDDNPYAPHHGGLPTVPASPLYPQDQSAQNTSGWGNNMSGYVESPDESGKQEYFTPRTGMSRVNTFEDPERQSTQDNIAGLQDMVEGAFKRQDTLLVTPSTDGGAQGISPILPAPSMPPKEEGGQWRQSGPSGKDQNTVEKLRTSSSRPVTPKEGAKRSSTPLMIAPVLSSGQAGEISLATPADSTASSSPEKDELSVFLGELERAVSPAPGSISGPTTPRAAESHQPRDSSTLGVPQQAEEARQSVGVFSLYDQYWNDDDEPQGASDPPPPPIQPKSPLRASPHMQETTMQPPPQMQLSKPSPPKVSIDTSRADTTTRAESPTPASSVAATPDSELFAMFSAGSKFLERPGTVYEATPRQESGEIMTPDTPRDGSGEIMTPDTPRYAGGEIMTPDTPTGKPLVITPTKELGPESDGIEAIGGPTVEPKPKTETDAKTAEENEYAKELLNQFSRPQTLMLKDTMPMPMGTHVMPAMPPMPQEHSGTKVEQAPEVVNFEREDEAGLEVVQPETPGLELVQPRTGETPPPLDKDDSYRPKTSGTTETIREHKQILFRDMKSIAALPTSAERTKAYNDLREYIANDNDGMQLSDWTRYQMEHNNGRELLEMQTTTLKPNSASLKKPKSNLTLISHAPNLEDVGRRGEEAKEKLHMFGKGALKVGEKAGGKVGGWMKKVGKK